MSLHLYDTRVRTLREFVPLRPGRVGVYLCGVTPQAAPHIGHLRSAVTYDILVRWLRRSGYDVTFCRNITDIDDKIIKVAEDEDVPWWAIVERNKHAFDRAYDLVGCAPPTIEPRATGHVPEMIVLMRRLIEAGHAYASGGDVYFDVLSWAGEYGALSNQRLENMRAAGDTQAEDAKRDPRDFALWKGAKPGEPAWETPWGPGRPGWHLECSAMATKYLGSAFDIHGGGVDLIFPHHENEIAQSRAAGDGFARYWVHNALLTVRGEKMSKSLGNSVLVSDLIALVRPVELRYYLGQSHYRSLIDYSDEALREAAAAYRRIEGFVTRAVELVGRPAGAAELGAPAGTAPAPEPSAATATATATSPGDGGAGLPDAFVAALNDDLGVPQALAVVHDTVRAGNNALAAGDKETVARLLAELREMLGVLAIDPLAPHWAGATDDLRHVVDALVGVALEQRQAARARKDYAAADAIRAQLAAAGIVVEDTPHGPRWELGDSAR